LPLGRAQEHGKRFIVVSAVAGLKLDLIHRPTPRNPRLPQKYNCRRLSELAELRQLYNRIGGQ
jgi:hypothetical protein